MQIHFILILLFHESLIIDIFLLFSKTSWNKDDKKNSKNSIWVEPAKSRLLSFQLSFDLDILH